MTVANCLMLLEKYKKQSENPVNSDGQPLHGEQRKHVMVSSKVNYTAMAYHILRSRKFNGATMDVRVKGGKIQKIFEKHPIVDELKKEFGLLEKKPEVKKEDGKKSKG